jgi:hypothetical protein
MKNEQVFEIEQLLKELTKSRSPITQKKAARALELFSPIAEKTRQSDFREERGLKWSWKTYDPLKMACRVESHLLNAPVFLNEAKEEIRALDIETQDYEHALELLIDLDKDKKDDITERLANVRRMRRVTKRFVELMEPFATFARDHKANAKKLSGIITEMQKTAESLENRTYTPRYARDLEEAFKQISATKEEN